MNSSHIIILIRKISGIFEKPSWFARQQRLQCIHHQNYSHHRRKIVNLSFLTSLGLLLRDFTYKFDETEKLHLMKYNKIFKNSENCKSNRFMKYCKSILYDILDVFDKKNCKTQAICNIHRECIWVWITKQSTEIAIKFIRSA